MKNGSFNMSTTNKFLNHIKKHQEAKKTEKFEGVLKDYLALLEDDDGIAVLAHKRLYRQITSAGITTLDESDERCNKLFDGDAVKVYDYFSSQFFGMERPLEKVMRFLHSAAMKGEESRQVLLLLGPVGAGKSALVEHIKGALEMSDPIYVQIGRV
jgi:serine protein kinase